MGKNVSWPLLLLLPNTLTLGGADMLPRALGVPPPVGEALETAERVTAPVPELYAVLLLAAEIEG